MLDSANFPRPKFDCAKCAGTGQKFGGICYACKGKGGFVTSPEARTRNRQRGLQLKRAGAQQENRNQSCYMAVMNCAHGDPLFIQMRIDHDAGRQWTPAQVTAAREINRSRAEAARLIGNPQPQKGAI